MTLAQLLTLAEQHRLTRGGGAREEHATGGPGLLDMAAMTRT
nr:hypothetical protein [Wenjunlia vitaminophila]